MQAGGRSLRLTKVRIPSYRCFRRSIVQRQYLKPQRRQAFGVRLVAHRFAMSAATSAASHSASRIPQTGSSAATTGNAAAQQGNGSSSSWSSASPSRAGQGKATASNTTTATPTVDSLTADLDRSRIDSIDAEVSDPRTLKDKLLQVDVDGEERPTLATFLQGRVFAEGGESVIVVGGDEMQLSQEEYDGIMAAIPEACKEIAVESSILLCQQENRLAYVMLRQIPAAAQDFVEVRVACVGNVDAGKSTTLGVLTRGGLDDGRGKARV